MQHLIRKVAHRWLIKATTVQGFDPDVQTVTMRVDTSDEWAILSIQLTGEWPRPLGGAAEKELAMLLYEKASKLPSWSSALARVPRTIETVDEYATDSRYDYGDGDDDYGEYDDREPVMQETAVPIPRSWRDIDQWDVQKNKATLSLSNRN